MSTTDGSRRNSRCSPAESTSKLFRESSEKRQAHGLPLPTEGERHMSQIPEVVVPTYDHLVLLDRSIEYDRPSLITFLFRGAMPARTGCWFRRSCVKSPHAV